VPRHAQTKLRGIAPEQVKADYIALVRSLRGQ
jgi:hypothetical protein